MTRNRSCEPAEVRSRCVGRDLRVDGPIQLQFLVRQRQAREQGVLVEQEIRDDLAPEQVQLAELGDLGGPLQQEA